MVGRDNARVIAANHGQAAAISKLHCQLFERGWDAESVQHLLAHPANLTFVAKMQGDAVLGFAIGQLAAGEAEILSLGVVPGCRARGIGSALVEAFVEAAQRKGVRRIFLDVAESNTAAISLYMRFGFVEMGRRKAYYLHTGGPREDALLMVRAL